VTPPKNNLKINDDLDLSYSFQENEETIVNQDFLSLLSAEALVAKPDSQDTTQSSLNSAHLPADGIFHASLKGFSHAGDYDVKITIDGKTFKREFSHHLVVSDSLFTLQKTEEEHDGKRVYAYKLNADLAYVDMETAKVTAKITNSLDNNMEKLLNTIGKDHWEFSFTPVQTAHYKVQLLAAGKTLDGADFNETILADEFDYPDAASVLQAQTPTHETAHQAEPAADENAHSDPVADEPESGKDSTSIWLYIAIGVGNLLVAIVAFFVYRLIAGRKGKNELAEIEDTLNADPKKMKKSPPENSKAKTVIDVTDDPMPMSTGEPELPDDDQMMADNLFPLDSMDDSEQK
jgi:hypothetical protein